MTQQTREVLEGRQIQGSTESIARKVTILPAGSAPTLTTVVAYDITAHAWTVVTSTVLTGSGSVAGDEITLPALHSLTADHTYWIEFTFTSGGNTLSGHVIVECDR